jgi:hypothetical protein
VENLGDGTHSYAWDYSRQPYEFGQKWYPRRKRSIAAVSEDGSTDGNSTASAVSSSSAPTARDITLRRKRYYSAPITVDDLAVAGGDGYNLLFNNCRHATKRMMHKVTGSYGNYYCNTCS